jgi:hypothetical protein
MDVDQVERCLELEPDSRARNLLGTRAVDLRETPTVEKTVCESKEVSARRHIADEILETEVNFVDKLSRFSEHVLRPLLSARIVADQVSVSFLTDVSQVWIVNSEVLQRMTQKMSLWDEEKTTIGDVFLSFSSMFKIYKSYVRKYASALAFLAKEYSSSKPRV